MMINRLVGSSRAFAVRLLMLGGGCVALSQLASCVAPAPEPPRPAPRPLPRPAPAPQQRPAPLPAPPPVQQIRPAAPLPSGNAAPVDWHDAPLADGIWRYRAEPGGSLAAFVTPAGQTVLSLRCNRAERTVAISRSGIAAPAQQDPAQSSTGAVATAVPASISASTQQRRLTASYRAPALVITLPAQDSLLDALAFSRGRFAVDIYGTTMLVVPAWSEVARVVEDCR
ncbi:hypothetical protein [Novosphingobium sp. FKTRR1]|uniref:hypothetical protein n=1 Tax=Novosphingobium sp. FKTRR1 TaxID=2879118 RepID=UPI001CEFC7A0|nr:hypothetical protein [Novosphingobium sp. FKTRR1]